MSSSTSELLASCVCYATGCETCQQIETQITRLLTHHRQHHDDLTLQIIQHSWHQPTRPDYTLRELLDQAREELGYPNHEHDWIARDEPELAWLAHLEDRSFYATPEAQTQLRRCYPEIAGHIWGLLLEDDR